MYNVCLTTKQDVDHEEEMKEVQRKNDSFSMNKTLYRSKIRRRQITRKMSSWIANKVIEEEKKIASIESVNVKDYKVYGPLLAGLKQHE